HRISRRVVLAAGDSHGPSRRASRRTGWTIDGRRSRATATADAGGGRRRDEPGAHRAHAVVLGMLANRGSQGGAPTQTNVAPQGGGGLGDLLGQVLGGAAGGRGGAGGLGGLLAQIQQAGFGEQADSWVSRGANQPISPDAMT